MCSPLPPHPCLLTPVPFKTSPNYHIYKPSPAHHHLPTSPARPKLGPQALQPTYSPPTSQASQQAARRSCIRRSFYGGDSERVLDVRRPTSPPKTSIRKDMILHMLPLEFAQASLVVGHLILRGRLVSPQKWMSSGLSLPKRLPTASVPIMHRGVDGMTPQVWATSRTHSQTPTTLDPLRHSWHCG